MDKKLNPETERLVLLVHNGTYTVSGPKGHRTFKIRTVKNGDLAGKRIIEMLIGPDNTDDYQGVAFWDEQKGAAIVWRRHRAVGSNGFIPAYSYPMKGSKIEKAVAILIHMAADHVKGHETGFYTQEGYSLQLAGTCVRCGRALTTPESIATGWGPVCWEKANG